MFRLRFQDLVDVASANLAGGHTTAEIVLNILTALFCGLFIYYVYKRTYSGVLYSKNIGVTMVIVTMITSVIVMAIHGNLALSLGMVGALSIVRFRTPIKDPKDLAFLFWAISSGVICGISAYKLVIVSAVFIGLCLFVLSKYVGWSYPYLLVIKINRPILKEIHQVLKDSCERIRERSSTIAQDKMEVVFEVVLKRISSIDLLNKVNQIQGIEKAVMVSYDGELDETR